MKNFGIAPQNKHLAFKSIHLRNEMFFIIYEVMANDVVPHDITNCKGHVG